MRTANPLVPVAAALIAGFAVMSLELLGSRLVAPVLGSSVLVWTNLIGVILVALATGAWLGGVAADCRPDWRVVSFFLAGAGIWSAGLAAWGHSFIQVFLPIPSGLAAPFVSLLLLAPPAFLLGAVPPAVLRLTVTDVARSGRAAGFLSAIGTLGSLFGTYLTGYILLPRFPVSTLLFGIAVALVLFAAAVASDALRKRLFLSVACLGAVLVPGAVTHSVPDGTVYPSAYAYVAVKDMPFEGNDVRALVINQGIHAASLHETPETSALEYVKGFRAVDAIVPAPIRMLALGGGGFHVAREFVARHPSSTVDVVEIDPAVMKAAQDAFGPMSDPRISVVMEDARSALPKLTPGYDVLVQDTYAGDLSVPWHLLTRESFAGYGRLLKPDGVFMSNLIMTDENGGSAGIRFQADAVATAKTAFRWVFAISVWKSSGQPMNVLLFAGNGPEPDHAAVLAAIRRETGSLWPREIQLADNGRVWTDDFGPADYESLAMYVEAGR